MSPMLVKHPTWWCARSRAGALLGLLILGAAGCEAALEPSTASERTDATPARVVDLEAGTCPDGLKLVLGSDFGVITGTAPDVNANGYFCLGSLQKTDDILLDDKPDKVTGHGSYVEPKGELAMSFSFHGLPTSKEKGNVKGEFEFHDQTNDLMLHGNVVCMIIIGNTAFLGGRVEQSDDPIRPVGSFVWWWAQDNGEGAGDTPDLVASPAPDLSGTCSATRTPIANAIDGGTIQIK